MKCELHSGTQLTQLSLFSLNSFPIDWLANELADNPVLAQAILHRFVDANHDGTVSAQELTGMGAPEANENNF